MEFNVGIVEVGLVVGLAVATIGCLALKREVWKWLAAVAACVMAASLVTPADPLSTLLMTLLLFAFFWGGVHFSNWKRQAAT